MIMPFNGNSLNRTTSRSNPKSKNATELQARFRDRQASLIQIAVDAYNNNQRPADPRWENDLVLLAKANLTIPAEQLNNLVLRTINSKKADFTLAALTRIMALVPGRYDEQVIFAAESLPGLWMSEGDEQGVFWSENHFLLWHSCSMILAEYGGVPLPIGWRERIVFYLKDKIEIGFYEFFSQVYYPFTLAGLLNLHDFASDPEIKELARQATLRLLQDFVLMTTEEGYFRVAQGRLTRLDYFTGTTQNARQTHVAALLGLGSASLPNSIREIIGPSPTFLATSDIDVGELLTERVDHVDTIVPIGRSISSFRENAKAALTDERDRITASWSMGQYFHPDTAFELFRNIQDYDLWGNHQFEMYEPFRNVSSQIVRVVAIIIQNFVSASILNAEMAIWRHGGSMLSSLQNGYFRGMRPAQQHPFFAVAGSAAVFTHASGDLNADFARRDKLQTHLPHIVQKSNVALLLYQPSRDLVVFLRSTLPVSLHWPSKVFAEETTRGNWKFAREGINYVAMWTPCLDEPDGFIVCDGKKQVWASVVGTEDLHGTFANFTNMVSGSAPIIAEGRCFGASLVMDGQEVSIEGWCQPFGEANTILALLIAYFVAVPILLLLMVWQHCRVFRKPDEPVDIPVFCTLMPRSTCVFFVLAVIYLLSLPIILFGFAVGFYGNGLEIGVSAFFLILYVVLHFLFVWYSCFKYNRGGRLSVTTTTARGDYDHNFNRRTSSEGDEVCTDHI